MQWTEQFVLSLRVKNARFQFTRKRQAIFSLYDRKFTPSFTSLRDGITCPGKCRSQSIPRSDRCGVPKNSGIVFTRLSSVCETEFVHVKRQTIASLSVLLIYFGFSTISTVPLDSPVPRSSLTTRRRAERVLALHWTFLRILLILWKKCLLFA